MSALRKLLSSALLLALAAATVSCASGPGGSHGLRSSTDARKIEAQSRAALDRLYKTNPQAYALAKNAEGVLVFPEILKAGFFAGGAVGDGALYQRNQPTGYYRTIQASYGLQAGIQKYGYALFLMDQQAIQTLNESGGWEIGGDPNIVVVDVGAATNLSTNTLQKGTYAIFFDQKGLMAGISLAGTKITRLNIHP